MVNVSAVSFIASPKANRAVVGGGDKFFACGGELHVHDCADVVFEDVEGAGEVSGVEEVDVVVFVRYCEIEGLHGVPGDGVTRQGEDAALRGVLVGAQACFLRGVTTFLSIRRFRRNASRW